MDESQLFASSVGFKILLCATGNCMAGQRVVGKVVGDTGLFFAVASSLTSSVDERYYVAALWPNRVLTRLSNEA